MLLRDFKESIYLASHSNMVRGLGAPSGTPSRAGLRYLDTTTGLMYLSRNVLNFNGSSIATPVITGVHRVNLQFWHNDPNPNTGRVLHDGLNGDGGALLIYASRAVTTGFISNATVGTTFVLDGASIASDTVNPSASTWHTLTTNSTTGRKLTRIGSNRTNALNYLGRIANVQILGASDVLLAQYAIDEGSGTTIFDRSGNGLHSTLDIGTGSWVLGWVPL